METSLPIFQALSAGVYVNIPGSCDAARIMQANTSEEKLAFVIQDGRTFWNHGGRCPRKELRWYIYNTYIIYIYILVYIYVYVILIIYVENLLQVRKQRNITQERGYPQIYILGPVRLYHRPTFTFLCISSMIWIRIQDISRHG